MLVQFRVRLTWSRFHNNSVVRQLTCGVTIKILDKLRTVGFSNLSISIIRPEATLKFRKLIFKYKKSAKSNIYVSKKVIFSLPNVDLLSGCFVSYMYFSIIRGIWRDTAICLLLMWNLDEWEANGSFIKLWEIFSASPGWMRREIPKTRVLSTWLLSNAVVSEILGKRHSSEERRDILFMGLFGIKM